MELISLKRDPKDGSYEISYLDEAENLQSLIIDAEQVDENRKLTEKIELISRGLATNDDLIEVLTGIVSQRPINQIKDGLAFAEGTPISAKIKLLNDSTLEIAGHKVTGPLSAQIMKMVDARRVDEDSVTNEDWLSLINFTEALYENMNDWVRKQLYAWLNYQIQNGRLTITTEGKFLGYKGLTMKGDDVVSIHSGPGIVNGKSYVGQLNNNPGNVVEISRDYVDSDPTVLCSTGLHVGSYDYAKSFGSVVALVEVDPRDVVSVPYDYEGQKLRACKYKVIKLVDNELNDFSVDFTEKSSKVGVFPEDPEEFIKANSENPTLENDEVEGDDEGYFNDKDEYGWVESVINTLESGDVVSRVEYSNDRVYLNVIFEKIQNDNALFRLSNGGYRSLKIDDIVGLIID